MGATAPAHARSSITHLAELRVPLNPEASVQASRDHTRRHSNTCTKHNPGHKHSPWWQLECTYTQPSCTTGYTAQAQAQGIHKQRRELYKHKLLPSSCMRALQEEVSQASQPAAYKQAKAAGTRWDVGGTWMSGMLLQGSWGLKGLDDTREGRGRAKLQQRRELATLRRLRASGVLVGCQVAASPCRQPAAPTCRPSWPRARAAAGGRPA